MRLIVFTFLVFITAQLTAAVNVIVDRDPVVIDESFQLVFNSDEQTSGQPDFSPLEQDFTIISKSNRNSTKIINGKVTYSQQWVLTVLPRQSGQLQIPAIKFGNETSPVRTINVVDSTAKQTAARDDIFIETSVNNAQPYVQAQVIFTVKLFRAIATSNATLSEPVLGSGQAIIDKLGNDKSYESQRQGKRYVVIERRYVIFPQNSGEITVEPLVFQGQTGAGGFLRFDPFGPSPKTIVKRSEPIKLDVQPIPASYPGTTWLPASNLSIQEQWSVAPDQLQQGEATTRTLTMKAEGLAASHLPAIDAALPDEFKSYPDQPEFEESSSAAGFIGVRKEKMAVIPTSSGDFMLPAIKIYWWDTTKDKLELAELPQRKVSVATVAPVDTATASNNADATIQQETANPAAVNTPKRDTLIWQAISAALLVLWLATMFAWYRNNRSSAITSTSQFENNSIRKLKTVVLDNAKKNDAQATSKALIAWANVQWPQAQCMNLGQLKQLVDNNMQQELDKLNAALYGQDKLKWQGEGLVQAFQTQDISVTGSVSQAGKLEPLYKT